MLANASENWTHPAPLFHNLKRSEFDVEFGEKFEFEIWLAAFNLVASRHCPPYISASSQISRPYVAASQVARIFNMAEHRNSPLNISRPVKSRP
jgi:hypothetical protein